MVQLSKNKLWFLEHFNLFKTHKREQMMDMEKMLVMKNISKNQILLFDAGKLPRIYFLKKGMIKIMTQNQEGEELIKSIIKPGELFGEIALLETEENEEDYAIAVENGIVCQMDMPFLKEMMQMNQELKVHIYKLIGIRIKKIENRLISMIFKNVETRIFDFLKEFVVEYGRYEKDYYYAKFFLTHKEVGKLTATTRQTVTKIMNELRDEGVLDYSNNFIKIYMPKYLS